MSVSPPRSGQEFLSDLKRRPRAVYVEGERVSDPSSHPAFREGARSIARLFDFAAAPENREAMSFEEGGKRYSAYFLPARSKADLEKRTGDVDGDPQRGAGHELFVIEVAGMNVRRVAADSSPRRRRRHPHAAKEGS